MNTSYHYTSPAPAKPMAMVYYRSDGSGRDKYIGATSGGFCVDGVGKRVDHYFMSTLRSSSPDHVSFIIINMIFNSY